MRNSLKHRFHSLSIVSMLTMLICGSNSTFGQSNAVDNPLEARQLVPTDRLQTDAIMQATWGMSVIPLPSYLRHEALGLTAGQGLLILNTRAEMPAHQAGLRTGQLIVEIDGVIATDQTGLPLLDQARTLVVLSDGGVLQVVVSPDLPLHSSVSDVGRLADDLVNQTLARAGLPIASRAQEIDLAIGPPTSLPPLRSLAVSKVNDQFVVSAVVDRATGPVKVELRGCEADVRKQLAALPPDVQAQLRPQLGM